MDFEADADILTLRRGTMTCQLSPSQGGSIARLTWQGPHGPVDVFRPASEWGLRNGSSIDMGCFPLFPFSNRIASGRFRFQGRDYEIPLGPFGCPHAMHGHGWRSPWSAEPWDDGDGATLVHRHDGIGWPWRYTAVQTIALEADGLAVTLALTNDDDGPMPAGIGLHPYLPKPPGTRLTAGVGGVWLNGPTILPVQRAPLPRAWNFPDGVVMDDVVLDNGFTGWDGRATVDWPGERTRLTLTADGPFDHLLVYAPPGGDSMCVEPVSHMTDALNHTGEPDAGLRVLAPGESLTGTLRFRLEAV